MTILPTRTDRQAAERRRGRPPEAHVGAPSIQNKAQPAILLPDEENADLIDDGETIVDQTDAVKALDEPQVLMSAAQQARVAMPARWTQFTRERQFPAVPKLKPNRSKCFARKLQIPKHKSKPRGMAISMGKFQSYQ